MQLLTYFLCFCVCALAAEMNEAYYWRDHDPNTTVPNDIFYIRYQNNEYFTHIGQTIYLGNIIPGNFDPYQKTIYFAFNNFPYGKEEDIKVFCTTHPERFEWIKTDKLNVKTLNKDTLVVVGFVENEDIYIGKSSVDKEMAVGMVMTPRDDGEAYVKLISPRYAISPFQFEILNYIPT